MNAHHGKRKRHTSEQGQLHNDEEERRQEAPESSLFTAHETPLLTDQPLRASQVEKQAEGDNARLGGLTDLNLRAEWNQDGEDAIWLDR